MMIFKLIKITCQAACHGKTEHGIFVKFKKTEQNCCCPHCRCHHLILRPAQRYDDFKLIKITCQAACHGKTEHGIFVKFKKPSKTAVVLIAGVTISFCARRSVMMILNLSKSLAKPLVMAKLNMAYLSSLKNRAKLLLSSLPVSPSHFAPGAAL